MVRHFLVAPILVCSILSCNGLSEQSFKNDSLVASLDSVNISYQFRGNCYAFNSENYPVPRNGEGHSSNLAQPTDSSFKSSSVDFYIDTEDLTTYSNEHLGHTLYLVNKSDSSVHFSAQDSRLNIIAEVLTESGIWKPISYLPSSWCGNSYHQVTLGANEFWEFDIPVFTGKFATKLRYVLFNFKDSTPLVTNEIDVLINKGQFDLEKKQGHNPNGLMDPYND